MYKRIVLALVACAAAALVVVSAGCGSTGGRAGGSGTSIIAGTVVAGPVCPVERADSPCPPRPVEGAFVELLMAGTVLDTAHTDATGSFTLTAAAGTYTVHALNADSYRSEVSETVELEYGKTKTVTLTLDTGIR